jgi:hypothetical protein
MPGTRAMERNSPFPNNSHKTYAMSSRSPTQDEESNGNSPINNRLAQRRASESPRKINASSKYSQSASAGSISQTQALRRSSNDPIKQNSAGSGSGQQRQSPPPTKPKCMLPTSVCQPGYVTPSKLFNMMGYGLTNQYLFMHAHYLYIIDCRTREKFDENHIITGKHHIFYLFI